MAPSTMTCTHCGGRVVAGLVDGAHTTACLDCGRDVCGEPQGHGATTAARATAPAGWKEADVVHAIQAAVKARGGEYLRICQMGGFGSGTSKGAPDLLVWVPGMPKITWAGVEVKRPGAARQPSKTSQAQHDLADRGRICIVDSVEAAMRELDAIVGTTITPEGVAEMRLKGAV